MRKRISEFSDDVLKKLKKKTGIMNRKIKLRLPVSILTFLLIIEVEKGLLLTNLYDVQNHLGLSSGFLQQISI